MEYPASVELLSATAELQIPFSDPVKYSILGISLILLLLALGILAWHVFRCCTLTQNTTHTTHYSVSRGLLYSDGKLSTLGSNSGTPSTKIEDVKMEVCRLSCCFSEGSLPSSGSSQSDGEPGDQANLQKVHGSLRFSLYYDQLQSRLVVTVLQAEGLQELSQTRRLLPFVKLRLMWIGSDGVEGKGCMDESGGTLRGLCTVLQEWRTRVVKGSCNPLFGDEFSCILQEEEGFHHITLRMEVRDFDKFSRHTVLGEVRVPVGQLNISYPLELQQDLQIPQKDLVGVVLLSLKLLPTSRRLEVGLLKVRMLPTEISSDAALYARVSVQCNQCKLRYQKTSAVARCHVTVFNQVLIFSLQELPLEECKILVSLYATQMTRKSSKHLIGQLTVGKQKSSEDKHWDLMMRSVRQPIAKWHCLLI
ncbi:hypothetical protein LDENG_00138460 [Lucifuga dentata]|nr:hypothetical protein LDENG_00138460 [Lucifuga dentata]